MKIDISNQDSGINWPFVYSHNVILILMIQFPAPKT